MASEPGWETIKIHILPKISRSNGHQTMKFGQSIEYDKRNIFLQKSCISIIKCNIKLDNYQFDLDKVDGPPP